MNIVTENYWCIWVWRPEKLLACLYFSVHSTYHYYSYYTSLSLSPLFTLPCTMLYLGGQWNCLRARKLDLSSTEMCAEKFPLKLMAGQATMSSSILDMKKIPSYF